MSYERHTQWQQIQDTKKDLKTMQRWTTLESILES